MLAQIEQVPVDVRVAARGLRHLEPSRGKRPALSSEDRAAIEHALATDYRHTLTPSGVFAPERFFLGMRPEHRAIADDVLRRHDSGQAPAATKRPILRTLEREATENRMPPLPAVGLMLMVGTFVAVACGGLLAAVAFRGGLMRLLGLEIATSSGRPASRLRVLARAMVAWSPLILLAVWSVTQNVSGLQIESPGALMVVMGAALAALLAGGLIALIRPERGIQDWIAGTWVVPR